MKKRNKRRAFKIQQLAVYAVIVAVVIVSVSLLAGGKNEEADEAISVSEMVSPTELPTSDLVVEPTIEPAYGVGDPDNYIYPYNIMSADWGAEIYEQGFRYFEIPEEYVRSGGCFPEVVQVYLWSLCREKGIDYYMVVAMIERESGYRYDASGDSGKSIGYLQIGERWHKDRMEAENVTDLNDPYGNIRVGLSFLKELSDRYGNSGVNCVLMAYNMGESGAKKCWNNGIYSSEYSREILARAEELKQEIEQG